MIKNKFDNIVLQISKKNIDNDTESLTVNMLFNQIDDISVFSSVRLFCPEINVIKNSNFNDNFSMNISEIQNSLFNQNNVYINFQVDRLSIEFNNKNIEYICDITKSIYEFFQKDLSINRIGIVKKKTVNEKKNLFVKDTLDSLVGINSDINFSNIQFNELLNINNMKINLHSALFIDDLTNISKYSSENYILIQDINSVINPEYELVDFLNSIQTLIRRLND